MLILFKFHMLSNFSLMSIIRFSFISTFATFISVFVSVKVASLITIPPVVTDVTVAWSVHLYVCLLHSCTR